MSMSLAARAFALAFGASLLAGCATAVRDSSSGTARPARTAIHEFGFDGRISVTRAAERAQASIVWQHVRDVSDEIELFSPVGSQLARLTSTPAGAGLDTAEHQRFEAPNAEMLSERIFGSPLPITGMPDWVLGRTAGQPVSEERDSLGRYRYLAEAGWVIRYVEYESEDATALPRSMDFERGDLHVRLRVDEWRGVK